MPQGGAASGDRELRVGRLQRQKVRVSRKRILESAIKVSAHHGRKGAAVGNGACLLALPVLWAWAYPRVGHQGERAAEQRGVRAACFPSPFGANAYPPVSTRKERAAQAAARASCLPTSLITAPPTPLHPAAPASEAIPTLHTQQTVNTSLPAR